MTEHRRCTGKGACGQVKPLDAKHFRARKDVPGAMYSICRACEAARAAGRRTGLGAIPRAPIGDDEVTDGRAVETPAAPPSRPPAQPREPDTILREHRRDAELDRTKTELRRLAAELNTAHERQRVLDALGTASVAPVVRREIASGAREATAVVLCSDWHVEEVVEPEKVNGLNEYSLAIADRRIERLTDGILWLLDMHRARFQIRDLVLWLGGDLMTGHIHPELVETSELHPIETVLWLHARILRMIDTLVASAGLERIIVPCSPGNHGRTTEKRRISTAHENSYEWLLYRQIAAHYDGHPVVEVIAPRAQLVYLDVYGRRMRFTHGESINFGGGVGGITIPINKAISGWNVAHRADVTCIGHFHQLTLLEHVVVNGSLIGHSPYAVAIRAPYEPPRQAWFLMDSERGRCCSTPIWVDERPEAPGAGEPG
jgi:hypothetical protein